jgi:hypothetical protein
MAIIQTTDAGSRSLTLAEVLERVLDKGLVIAGDIKIKLCDVELLTIQIRLLVASVDKAREMGLTWWWQSPQEQPHAHLPPSSTPCLPPAGEPLQSPWEHYQQFRRCAQTERQP